MLNQRWIGIVALASVSGIGAMIASVRAAEGHDLGNLDFAQSEERNPNGKPEGIPDRPSKPPVPKPSNGIQTPNPVLQSAPQAGVPARCAGIADATERQRCIDTPKGPDGP